MKKITIILIALTINLIINAQAKRVSELDVQATRVDTAWILVDDDAYTGAAKKIKAEVLSPKIGELPETSAILDKDVNQMPYTAGGIESQTDIRYIFPDIADYATKSGGITSTDYFRVSSSGVEKKAPISYITTEVVGSSALQTAVNADIDARVTNAFVNANCVTTEAYILLENGGTAYGRLYAQRLGRMVVGHVFFLGTSCSNLHMDYNLPWVPLATTLYFGDFDGTAVNWFAITSDGSVYITNDGTSFGVSGSGFGFCYITSL